MSLTISMIVVTWLERRKCNFVIYLAAYQWFAGVRNPDILLESSHYSFLRESTATITMADRKLISARKPSFLFSVACSPSRHLWCEVICIFHNVLSGRSCIFQPSQQPWTRLCS